MTKDLLFPAFFYLVYIFLMLIANFFHRKKLIKQKKIHIKYFRDYQGQLDYAAQIRTRHFDHQFQVPAIFIVTCGLLTLAGNINSVTLGCAWGFVISRFIHSFVHLGTNNVLHRAGVYAVGWLFLLTMWAHWVFVF